MFQVHVNDGSQEIPNDDIFYIVAKEGIFLKKKMGIMESLAPVKTISILNSVSTSAKMHIPKLPSQSFAKVIEFFKQVYDEHRSEAIVLLFYNEETKKYKIIPPKQKVSIASLDYNRSITMEGYTMIGDIHSHGHMSAFHSGVDNADEESFDGLHITIGNAGSDEISISSSIVANGYRFMTDPTEYVAGLKLTKDVDQETTGYTTKVYKTINGKLVLDEAASKRGSYKYRKFDKRYISTVSPSKRKINASWMEQVEKISYVYTLGHGLYGRNIPGVFAGTSYRNGKWEDYNKDNLWGDNFDPHAWQQYRKVGAKPPANAIIPKVDTKPEIQTPTFDSTDEQLSPCLTCNHRHEKILFEECDSLEDEMYICEKCGVVISGESDELTCLDCKTGDHLKLITEEDFVDNYESCNDISSVKCNLCHTDVLIEDTATFCPICQAPVYDKETEMANQFDSDSGVYDNDDTEKINEESLKQIQHAQENVNKIPDPEKSEIPIPIKTPEAAPTPAWKMLLKKAFMKGD